MAGKRKRVDLTYKNENSEARSLYILDRAAQGASWQQIANELGISVAAVQQRYRKEARGQLSHMANIVAELDGILFTPPVSSGLLAGVFRAWLLDQGKIRERVLSLPDLDRSTGIFLINSVRKWQEAELVQGKNTH